MKKDKEFELPLATLTVDASVSRRRHVDAVFCVDVVEFFPSTPTPSGDVNITSTVDSVKRTEKTVIVPYRYGTMTKIYDKGTIYCPNKF